MILSTSAVAVCCCNDSSRSSFSSRVFSMAITACLAKLLSSSICLSLNGRTSCRYTEMVPISSVSRSIGTMASDRAPALRTSESPPDRHRDRPAVQQSRIWNACFGSRSTWPRLLFG